MIKLYKPACYDSFHCLASLCPDTCCQQWDIDIDPDTYRRYQALPGPLGQKIRASLQEGEDGPVFSVSAGGQCPMHRADGLCAIQAELGEEALCQVCREFPRLRHDYGDFVELGLEMSCPEAARILLTAPDAAPIVQQLEGLGEGDYDQEAMDLLKKTRIQALALLREESLSLPEALTLLFFYGVHVQQQLDGEEAGEFSPAEALETARSLNTPGDIREMARFFLGLDILTGEWKQRLSGPLSPSLHPKARNLARYLVNRYWLQAVSDYDLYCRVKFILISCLLVSSLGGDFIDTAHLWSKEIENDCDNLDAILDAAYESPVFTDSSLVSLVLFCRKC